MQLKRVRKLTIVAVALQAIVLLLTIGVTVFQQEVRQVFFYNTSAGAPVDAVSLMDIANALILLVIYGCFLAFIMTAGKKLQKTKTAAVLFLAAACFIRILFAYLPSLESMMLNLWGTSAEQLVSYAVLRQMVTTITSPFSVLAFAVFCFSLGVYLVKE